MQPVRLISALGVIGAQFVTAIYTETSPEADAWCMGANGAGTTGGGVITASAPEGGPKF